jgi:hypothetical protein
LTRTLDERGGNETMPSLSIIEWKRTSGQYVAVLQSVDNFEPGTIKEIEKHGFETVLGGRLRGSDRVEWYALAYDRRELEFDEARDIARAKLDSMRSDYR